MQQGKEKKPQDKKKDLVYGTTWLLGTCIYNSNIPLCLEKKERKRKLGHTDPSSGPMVLKP